MKKLLFTLLCAILALSVLMGALVSCNNTDKTDDKGGNETTENNNESDNTDVIGLVFAYCILRRSFSSVSI